MKITPEYLAGFIDGEGHIGLYVAPKANAKGYKAAGLKVTICNTHLGVMLLVREFLGGSLRTMKVLAGRKTGYQLTWNGRKARTILEMIRPHVIVKKSQVELAFEFFSLRDDPSRLISKKGKGPGAPHRSDETIAKEYEMKARMNDLNRRGVPQC